MMYRTRTLNLVDIMQLKKDLLWGRYYYGLFEDGKLVDTLLFSNYFDNRYLIEIHYIESKAKEFLNKFTHDYAHKRKVRYFVRELNEASQVADIEFMNSCGFKRFNRNYCFQYDSSKHNPNDHLMLKAFCREIEKHDIPKLIEIDASSQIIDYRDELHKSSKFFKNNLEKIFVFTSSSDMESIYGFAYKRDLEHSGTFEFVIHPRHADIIEDCIRAFADSYIHVEKSSDSFRFIINENHKHQIDELRKHDDLVWSSQLLILEGTPREKVAQPTAGLAFNQATSNASPYPQSSARSTQSDT